MAGTKDAPSRFEFKRAFFRGLAVLLPSVVTLWIIAAAFQFIDRNIAEPINGLARSTLAWASTAPGPLQGRFDPSDEQVRNAMAEYAAALRRPPNEATVIAELRDREVAAWWSEHWLTRPFGFVVALLFVYVMGRIVGGWLGRKLFGVFERLLGSMPLIRQIYPSVKQIVSFFFSDGNGEKSSMQFSRVVIVQYPRPGVWSVGFLTGSAMRAIADRSGGAVTVFIPSSPPFSGWTVSVPTSEVHELPITIDEAIRYIVSGGVVVPAHQNPGAFQPLAATPSTATPAAATIAGSPDSSHGPSPVQ
jgi:uncharacterized membrane protein